MGTYADDELTEWQHRRRKLARHVRWLRTEGLARLVEEDRLDPVERMSSAVSKAVWRARSGARPGTARPVYVVGLQRSGTNMLLHGIEAAPEVEVRNENDRQVFTRFRLRSDEVVAAAVARSRHRVVLFKPLCDSHRVRELLALAAPDEARAVWVVRDPDERTRSAVAKFGPATRQALARVAAGEGERLWQAGGLDDELLSLLRSFDHETMTDESAGCLFWYLRNSLYFSQRLDMLPAVRLVSYERVLADPVAELSNLATFLGLPFRDAMAAHVRAGAARAPRRLDIDPRVRRLTDELGGRLDAALAAQSAPVGG